MASLSFRREAPAIVLSLTFLGLGVVTVWVSKAVLGLDSDAVFVSLLLLPIICLCYPIGALGRTQSARRLGSQICNGL